MHSEKNIFYYHILSLPSSRLLCLALILVALYLRACNYYILIIIIIIIHLHLDIKLAAYYPEKYY